MTRRSLWSIILTGAVSLVLVPAGAFASEAEEAHDAHGATTVETHAETVHEDAHGTHVVDAHAAEAHGVEAHGEEHGSSNQVDPIHHVVDSRNIEVPWPNSHLMKEVHLPSLGTFHIGGIEVEMAITKHLVAMWMVSLILILFILNVARKASSDRAPSGAINLLDVLVTWMRDNVTVPTMGPVYGRKLLPYMLTVFFFILFGNLFGLIPYSSTMTGNLSVTAALAVMSFFLIQDVAIKEAGLGGYLKHLTGGVHPALWFIMIPVEFMGLFTKPFALAIRLFANMSAGHIVILSLLGLIFIFGQVAVAGLAVPFALFIYLLEILVAFIQAFIFTMLTSVFTGMGVHTHHAEAH